MALDPENISVPMNISENENNLEEDSSKIIEDSKVEDAPKDKPGVKQRVQALKKIQIEMNKQKIDYYQERLALDAKYMQIYLPFFEKRRKIVIGEDESTVEDCDFVGVSDSDVESDAEKGSKREPMECTDATTKKVSGIPDFWLTVIQNVEILQDITEEHDVPILKHLTNVTVEMMEGNLGYRLEFHFSPNEYFTNRILTKVYEMDNEVEEHNPLNYRGPCFITSTGCSIDWAEGKNVTVKTIEKHQKNDTNRIARKTVVKAPSFFNFFKSPKYPWEDSDFLVDKKMLRRFHNDAKIGRCILAKIVNHAVHYYTGEVRGKDSEGNEDENGDAESRVPQGDSDEDDEEDTEDGDSLEEEEVSDEEEEGETKEVYSVEEEDEEAQWEDYVEEENEEAQWEDYEEEEDEEAQWEDYEEERKEEDNDGA